jgi:predicted dithiol-disulfide oxidoreductase (DUF899 family)
LLCKSVGVRERVVIGLAKRSQPIKANLGWRCDNLHRVPGTTELVIFQGSQMLTGTRRQKRRLICATLFMPAALLLAPAPPAGAVPVPFKNCGKPSDILQVQTLNASVWPPPTAAPLVGTATIDAAKEETNMRELRYPNESGEYRDARDSLLKEEQELIDKVKSVAERRRNLPPGGQLKEDYVFQWANDGKVGIRVKFSELFAGKNTLLLYSFMYGPNWDKPCPSCTSLVDGFDRTWYQVTQDAAFVAIAKAPADRINAWAKQRGWSQISLVSGSDSAYQADYKCQGDSDDRQWPVMHVFRRERGKIVHFWGTELSANHLDTVWPYWNLMDFTPEGRPDIPTPPQNFRSEFLEKHYLNKE